ncbi:hypothetical protein B0H13DRAFT_2313334 [Mycena leptocephala]|nr:hypothetical protein B0H13DRAFT_2313334 [Mycena leptocephala]
MLQLLALQHELGEPLDLNGDTFDDLVEGDIKATQMESHEATRAMFLATKPKLFSHKRFWDLDAFHASLLQFSDTHAIFDPMFRPPTFNCFGIREIRRPATAIEMAPSDEEKSRGNIRRRTNDDEELAEDIPLAKRQATPRRLRPRGNDSRAEKVALAPPVGKVVASGRGCGDHAAMKTEDAAVMRKDAAMECWDAAMSTGDAAVTRRGSADAAKYPSPWRVLPEENSSDELNESWEKIHTH